MRWPDRGVSESPFWHVVTDGLWEDDVLRAVHDEIPDPVEAGFGHYSNAREEKFEGGPSVWGARTRDLAEVLASRHFCRSLTDLSGVPELRCEFTGGGYHVIPPGGLLAVHADFNRSPRTGLYRRLNLLIYLNEGWTDEDGGQLELWDSTGPVVSVLPVFNRTVVFKTSSSSFHGHPHPLPGPRWRKSFAAYYFSPEPAPDYVGDHSTVFHA